jgi:hypothetical protein
MTYSGAMQPTEGQAPMTVYAIHAMISTHAGDYEGSKAVPLFYLDSTVQGIVSATHACEVATAILNPLGSVPAGDVHVSAYAMPDGGRLAPRTYTHTVKTTSGYTAGWFGDQGAAQAFADTCNASRPSDIAHVELMQGDEAWDALFASEAPPTCPQTGHSAHAPAECPVSRVMP